MANKYSQFSKNYDPSHHAARKLKKRQYSEAKAWDVATTSDANLGVYKCPQCGFWHVYDKAKQRQKQRFKKARKEIENKQCHPSLKT